MRVCHAHGISSLLLLLLLLDSDVKGVQPLGVGGGPAMPPPLLRPGDPLWVEQSFSKRDCSRFVTSTKEVSLCACGQTWAYHKTHGVDSVGEPGEAWAPAFHTTSSPTDAYGTIDFLGGPHPNKAQFIRLGFDSRSDLILQLLTREWGLELPKLIISVHGGKANFELNPRLKRILRKGLLRAAKTTGMSSLFLIRFDAQFKSLSFPIKR